MPHIGKQLLNQKAVLWAFANYTNRGEIQVSAGVEINVRWEEEEREVPGPEGSPIVASGTVFVEQEITRGSILWLGKLTNLPSTVSSGLMEALALDKIFDVKGRVVQRSVTIKRFKDSLPSIV